DEQHRWSREVGFERLEQRSFDEKPLGKDFLLERIAALSTGFSEPDLDHLALVVPLIDRGSDVEPFIALEANEATAERLGQHLRDLRLANARLALEEKRPVEREREIDCCRQAAIGDVLAALEQSMRVADGGGEGHGAF